jgi:hypothetical protein
MFTASLETLHSRASGNKLELMKRSSRRLREYRFAPSRARIT